MFFFLTQFLQNVLGYSALVAGLAFLPLTVMLFASSQLSARVLTGRVPAKTVMVGGLTISTLGPALAHSAARRQRLPGPVGSRCCCSAWAMAWRSCR